MIKNPSLLILDEPCDGLDSWNRAKLLKIIDFMGKNTTSTLILTTHREDEIPGCVKHLLHMNKGKATEMHKRPFYVATKAVVKSQSKTQPFPVINDPVS